MPQRRIHAVLWTSADYLDPSRTVAEAVADIEALATANAVRPYFLAIHVREFSTVKDSMHTTLSHHIFTVFANGH